jgi:hypothetical protein
MKALDFLYVVDTLLALICCIIFIYDGNIAGATGWGVAFLFGVIACIDLSYEEVQENI